MSARNLAALLGLAALTLLGFAVPTIGLVLLGLAVVVMIFAHGGPWRTGLPGAERLPWKSFLILTALFFAVSGDITYSLHAGEKGLLKKMSEADPGRVTYGPREIAFVCLAVLASVVLFRMRNKPFHLERKWRFLMWGFAGIACLSAFQSDYPVLTLKRLGLLAIFVLLAIAYGKRFSMREVVWLGLFSSFIFVGVGVAAEISLKTFTPFVADYHFQGTDLYNFTGWQIGTLILAALALCASKSISRGRLLAILLFAVPLMLLTKSREANAGLLVAILAYRYLVSGKRTIAWVLWGLLVLAAVSFMVLGSRTADTWRYIALMGRTEHASTLTGRTPVWESLIGYAAARPLLGYGYGTFWTPARIQAISKEQGWDVGDAHLDYLNVLLEVGILGVVLFILIQILAIRRYSQLYKATHDPDYAFAYAFLIFIQCNMFLASVLSVANITTFLWIFVLIRISSRQNLNPATQSAAAYLQIRPAPQLKRQVEG
jgi:O-antigen ligase